MLKDNEISQYSMRQTSGVTFNEKHTNLEKIRGTRL